MDHIGSILIGTASGAHRTRDGPTRGRQGRNEVRLVLDGGVDRRCAEKLRELESDIPTPFDLAEFCACLERRRGRAIRLIPITTRPQAPCGVCIVSAEVDYIYHERGTSALHQAHIVLHEIAHMLLDHDGGVSVRDDLALTLTPDLNPALVQLMLGRATYTAVEEREAEMLASLILERAHRPTEPRLQVVSEVAEILDRVDHTWGRGRRGA